MPRASNCAITLTKLGGAGRWEHLEMLLPGIWCTEEMGDPSDTYKSGSQTLKSLILAPPPTQTWDEHPSVLLEGCRSESPHWELPHWYQAPLFPWAPMSSPAYAHQLTTCIWLKAVASEWFGSNPKSSSKLMMTKFWRLRLSLHKVDINISTYLNKL